MEEGIESVLTSSWGAYYVGVYTMDCQTARLQKDFNRVPQKRWAQRTQSAIDIINAKDIEKKKKEICDPNLFNCNTTKDINGLVTTRNEFPIQMRKRYWTTNYWTLSGQMGVSSIL